MSYHHTESSGNTGIQQAVCTRESRSRAQQFPVNQKHHYHAESAKTALLPTSPASQPCGALRGRFSGSSAMIRYAALAASVLFLALFSSCSGEPPASYISLGDSLAVGVGASDPRDLGYAPLYRDQLERVTGSEVELIQLGIAGETSESFVHDPDSQLARAEKVLAEHPGATVTLSLGGNDLLSVASGTDAEREEAVTWYARNLDYALKILKEASDPSPQITVLALYNPAPGSFTDEWTGRLNTEIRRVATINAVSVAAVDETFQDREGEYTHHSRYPWDVHPTDEGYEALARTFAET